MADHRITVTRLIALAINPGAGEHEARNAAMKACKLIHEHKLLDAAVAEAPHSPFGRSHADPFSGIEEIFRAAGRGDAIEQLRRERDRQRAAAEKARETWKTNPQPAPFKGEVRVPRAVDPNAVVVAVPEATACAGCGQRNWPTRMGILSRGQVWHSDCLNNAAG